MVQRHRALHVVLCSSPPHCHPRRQIVRCDEDFLLFSAVVHCFAIFVVRLCAAAEIFLLLSVVAHSGSFDILIVRLYAAVYIFFWFMAVCIRFVCPVLLLCRLLRHSALWHLYPIDNIFNSSINNSSIDFHLR